MSDHFPQEGLTGVFFEQIWCDKVNILLNGLCHGGTDIFRVKLYIPEVKYKKRKLLRENFYSEQRLFFLLLSKLFRQRGWSCCEKIIRYLLGLMVHGQQQQVSSCEGLINRPGVAGAVL